METAWNAFVVDCRERYGVGTRGQALAHGIPQSTFHRRTDREGWGAPFPGVRVAPWVRPSRLTDLATLLAAAGPGAAAAGRSATWLHGIDDASPRHLEVVIAHERRVPTGADGLIRRCRWLRDEDVVVARRLPVLTPAATLVSLADLPPLELRALVIDATQRGLVELAAIGARLSAVGPVRGRRSLARILFDLADKEAESVFHDIVLDELARRGYRPARAPMRVPTPDGRGVRPDIPFPQWFVAIEVQGDRFHRTRSQRAADRRKMSQYAGSGWLVLQLDWWEWMGNRRHFLEALDATILTQVERGVADPRSVPPHLAAQAHERVHPGSPGAEPPAGERDRTR